MRITKIQIPLFPYRYHHGWEEFIKIYLPFCKIEFTRKKPLFFQSYLSYPSRGFYVVATSRRSIELKNEYSGANNHD